MGRVLIITVIALTLLGTVFPAKAQNPFISKEGTAEASAPPGVPHPFLERIGDWQQQLNQKMAALTREARERGNIRPLLSLIAITFMYGVLHGMSADIYCHLMTFLGTFCIWILISIELTGLNL
jgi:hypothetical protein